jgi:hypothetical protein
VAHTTMYEYLLDLAISLGCNYLKELHVGENANHHSRQIVGVFANWESFTFFMRDTYCQSSTKAVLKMLVAD